MADRSRASGNLTARLDVELTRRPRDIKTMVPPQPVVIDQHYSPQFYAELWGMSPSSVIRWFQDMEGVLKLSRPANNGKRARVELRIPFSLAMSVYREHTAAS